MKVQFLFCVLREVPHTIDPRPSAGPRPKGCGPCNVNIIIILFYAFNFFFNYILICKIHLGPVLVPDPVIGDRCSIRRVLFNRENKPTCIEILALPLSMPRGHC